MLQYVPLLGIPIDDGKAVRDLTPRYRKKWIGHNALPKTVYYLVPAAAQIQSVSRVHRDSCKRLARYDPTNDSQVIWSDGVLAGSELMAILNADHWAVALPLIVPGGGMTKLLVNKDSFPREFFLRSIHDCIGKKTVSK